MVGKWYGYTSLCFLLLYSTQYVFTYKKSNKFHQRSELEYDLHSRTKRDNSEYKDTNQDVKRPGNSNEGVKRTGNDTNCHEDKEAENCTITENFVEENHRYYLSHYYSRGTSFFTDLSKSPKNIEVEKHERLSNSYKKAFRIPIEFHFPFYGNFVDRIVVTTGGFINIGPQFHSFVHRVHYVAPLMADFNPSTNNQSVVYIGKNNNVVIVQWTDFLLNGKENANKTFTFQVSLYRNGTIVLAYKTIPIPPTNIKIASGDVGVTAGFSDGFIITYRRHDKYKLIVHNLIYSYHKVNLPLLRIKNGAAYKLTLLPNCIQFKTCSGCLSESKKTTNFTCRWCPKLNQCSDALDWHRQRWLIHCVKTAHTDASRCDSSENERMIRKFEKLRKKKRNNKGSNTNTTVGIIIGMLLFAALIIAASVFTYAYTHPLSKPGLFLMENRRPWKKFQNVNNDDDYAMLTTT